MKVGIGLLKVRKITTGGLLVSMGLILHFVEGMIPMTSLVPGARLGLSNIVSLIALVIFGFKAGFFIIFLRIMLGSLLAGTFLTINFYLSLAGGIISFIMMAAAYYLTGDKFSLIGISVLGAVFHNTAQIITAYYIVENTGIFYYLPYLLLLAVPAGVSVGLISYFSLEYLPGYFYREG